MHCTEFKQNLDDYLDGELAADMLQRMETHLEQCDSCWAEVQQGKFLLASLQQHPLVAMRPGFAQQAFRHAARMNRQPQKHRHWFAAGFGGMMAAGLMLALLLGPMRTLLMPTAEVSAISMSVQEERTVNVVFNAPQAMQGVELELVLSDGLELAGRPGERQLRWQTSLKAGSNRLAIPVRALRSGKESLVARLHKDGQEKELHIHLEIRDGVVSAGQQSTLWI